MSYLETINEIYNKLNKIGVDTSESLGKDFSPVFYNAFSHLIFVKTEVSKMEADFI